MQPYRHTGSSRTPTRQTDFLELVQGKEPEASLPQQMQPSPPVQQAQARAARRPARTAFTTDRAAPQLAASIAIFNIEAHALDRGKTHCVKFQSLGRDGGVLNLKRVATSRVSYKKKKERKLESFAEGLS